MIPASAAAWNSGDTRCWIKESWTAGSFSGCLLSMNMVAGRRSFSSSSLYGGREGGRAGGEGGQAGREGGQAGREGGQAGREGGREGRWEGGREGRWEGWREGR